MATTRMRRAGANPPPPPVEEEERVYTEEDYAVQESLPDEWQAEEAAWAGTMGYAGAEALPDEAFAPDSEPAWDAAPDQWAEDAPPPDAWVEDGRYAPLFPQDEGYTDELDPLSEELLTEEELQELRRSHWQLLSGLADFGGVILGTAAILLLITLLVSLINWLVNDMSQSFILLQKNL
ncbi:MAG: hypothetical protein IJB81_13180 [Clostridia bacterium]|nr:hypothetical protein [Clostridia bacterium]